MKIKSTFKKISLFLLSLIITLLAIEAVLRILGEAPQQFNKDDSDYIVYDSLVEYTYLKNIIKKNANVNYSINISTNSFGYRDQEWLFYRSEKRILVPGNFYSAGYGIDKSFRYSNLLSTEIEKNSNQLQ